MRKERSIGRNGQGQRGHPPSRTAVLLLGVLMLALGMTASAGADPGLTVADMNHGVTASTLANTLIGSGVTISNVKYVGSPRAAGTFGGGGSIIGFDRGIVLSTGNVQTVSDPLCSGGVEGPNTCFEGSPMGLSNSTSFGTPGDADLTTLSGFDTFDAAVLEFDFVPQFSTIEFKYVFTSEEYSDFANTNFNDVFAFFVNGVNCALVPGTSQPVSVNTINNGNDRQGQDPTPHHPELFRSNVPPQIDTQMDGLTIVLTCKATVNPGQTNHMKLAIADASDGDFDSAVFIEAGSFVSLTSTTIATSLKGGGQSGTRIAVPLGTPVTDSATLSGTNISTAVGTVNYAVFSDAGCATRIADAGTKNVTNGQVPDSNPVTFNTAGTFFWMATYSGDTQNGQSSTTCGQETVVVDATPPDTTITSGPTGAIPAPGSATFTWSGTDDVTSAANLVFAFRLDPIEPAFSAFGSATSRTYTGLAPGSYTFLVKARDGVGNEDLTPANRSFSVVDATPPDTTITSGPTGAIPAPGSATFTWTGTDGVTAAASLVFAFRLDPIEPTFSAFGSATSTAYAGLAPGAYTFLVKARDAAGNEDPTPATQAFSVVDVTPPETTITSVNITGRNVTITWTGSDVVTPTAGLTFAFRLDPVDTSFSAFGSATSKTYTNLAPGQYVFSVKARDAAGHEDPTPAVAFFTSVDTTPPDTVISGGPTGDVLAPGSATFTWTGTDDVTSAANLVFAFRLDPIEPTFSTFGSATSKAYTGLAPGGYSFLVKARDAAGNEDPTPAVASFTVLDTTAPETTITSGPPAAILTNSASFTWTGSGGNGALSFAFRLDPLEPTFSAFGGVTSKTYTGLANGTYTFLVKAADDRTGTEDPTPAARVLTVDTGGGTVSAMTGTVHVIFEGQMMTLDLGSPLVKGMTVLTGGDGAVTGSCSDGSQFTLGPNSSVFLDDSLCQQSGSGVVDMIQGQFTVVASSAAVQSAGARAA
ncbi:MAG: hypothetical protein C5B48_00470, partial [Candidatus Rokuibacteriota bacterium]